MRILKYLTVVALLFICSALLTTDEGRAENIVVGPQFDVFIGPNTQLVPFVAFDPYNRRFLVVWNEHYTGSPTEVDIFGQLLNADGTPYGGKISIAVVTGSTQGPARIAFDLVNRRFLVIFLDNRNNGQYQAYGQFLNADGTLYGGNFSVTPSLPQGHTASPVAVAYDSNLNRFFVLILKNTGFNKADLFGQFVGVDGSLIGGLFQVTSSPANSPVLSSSMGYDSNYGRFLIAYGRATINRIEGMILNGDGTTFLGNFLISPQPGGIDSYPIPFDPIDNRFLVLWNTADYYVHGRMITSDGMVICNELLIPFNPDYDPASGVAIFDASRNKFIVVANSMDPAISGQVVTPDGVLEGRYFPIAPSGNSAPLRPFLVFGSATTGALVVWPDNQTGADYDLYGRFLMPGGINYATATIAHYYSYITDGDFIVEEDPVLMDEKWAWFTANIVDTGAQMIDATFAANTLLPLIWEGQPPSSQASHVYNWNYGTDIPEDNLYGVGGRLEEQSQQSLGLTAERDVEPERLDDPETMQTISVDVTFTTMPPAGAAIYIGNVNDAVNPGVITSEVISQNDLPKFIEKVEYGRAAWSIASADIELNTTYTFIAEIKATKSPSVTNSIIWKPSVEIEMFNYAASPPPAAGTSFTLAHPGGVTVTFGAANSATWLSSVVLGGIKAQMEPVYEELPDLPNAPSGLAATNITSTGCTLNWTDNSDNETGFIIQRTDGNGNVVTFQVGPNITTFTDDTAAPNTTYTYVVMATNAGGNSDPSDAVIVTTQTGQNPPNAPSALIFTGVTTTSVTLGWQDNSDNETGFVIVRTTNGATTEFPVGADTPTFTDTAVTADVTYTYFVLARNAGGNSAPSNSRTITVPVDDNLMFDPNAPSEYWAKRRNLLYFWIHAVAKDGKPPRYYIKHEPRGTKFFRKWIYEPKIDKNVRAAHFWWIPSVSQDGDYTITIIAKSHDKKYRIEKDITIHVKNDPPTLLPIGNKVITATKSHKTGILSFYVQATDTEKLDIRGLRFRAKGLPKGAHLNSKTGYFKWDPSLSQRGTYTVRFYMKDYGGLMDEETITITVL